jgi:hypothetical protein
VLSRTEIAEQVWDMNFDSDTSVVEVAIRRLRTKIDVPFDYAAPHHSRHGICHGGPQRMKALLQHRSLRQRLSWWLALQSFADLGVVCLMCIW